MNIFGLEIKFKSESEKEDEVAREYKLGKYSDYCDGSNRGYTGPKNLEYLFNQGINPRCGRPLSQCSEGMGHVCGDVCGD